MHHPLGVARLSCNLPYTFPVLFLPRSVPAFRLVRVRFGSRGREQRAVWNPLACWGISVSLWEPYWLPSFIIIPPPLAPSVSGTDHAFSFSPVLLAFIPSSPCLFFCFVFSCYFYPSFRGIKTTFLKVAPKVCMLKPLTSWVTQYLCVYWCYLRCSDILTGSMQSYHILHENENPNQL